MKIPSPVAENNYPKLHNAMWPGLVGKGSPGAEPCIGFDTLLDLTARAEVNGVRFDGVDLFLSAPHLAIGSDDAALQRLADKLRRKNLVAGSVVAPVWEPTGGGSAMGGAAERSRFLEQVRQACRIGARLREIGVRPYGIVRIDSAASVSAWAQDPRGNTRKIAATFREAAAIAAGHGERIAAEGEICWGGMHSWKHMLDLLEAVGRPEVLGFQADMSHTLLYLLGENASRHRLVPREFHWEPAVFHAAMTKLVGALRPWTVDFHVAQNDGSVFGSGTHEKTGRHCLPTDPRGKLNLPRDSGYWLRDVRDRVTRTFPHICWDGCMFPNRTMLRPQIWNDILAAMIEVRRNHGWRA
jgi:hypothetical protein